MTSHLNHHAAEALRHADRAQIECDHLEGELNSTELRRTQQRLGVALKRADLHARLAVAYAAEPLATESGVSVVRLPELGPPCADLDRATNYRCTQPNGHEWDHAATYPPSGRILAEWK